MEAAASIRPHEAGVVLCDLTESYDEDIVEAAFDAMAMADRASDDEYEDKHEDDEFNH